jgi:uncharacterized protein YdeI (YjbR/CyaY-like superfamily)
MDPLYFPTPADLREWFAANHTTVKEFWLGYYKKESGTPSVTWPESVDQALCFGWIDGLRKGIDGERYMIRFTPRKPSSIWSSVNIQRVAELTAQGLMQPAGLAAFEKRTAEKSSVYGYEQRDQAVLPEEYESQLRANAAAWAYFQGQTPSYRKGAIHWVMSAKQAITRDKRLATLIADSAQERFIPPFKFSTANKRKPGA